MPKFKATVCRTSYETEAKEKILDEAGNHLYSEKESNYTLDGGVIPSEN